MSADGVRARVKRSRGRPPAGFSKRGDGRILFDALREQGVAYRQASDAVRALLGVDAGERQRAQKARADVVFRGQGEKRQPKFVAEPGDVGAGLIIHGEFVLSKYAAEISARLLDPASDAYALLEELPADVVAWIRRFTPVHR